MSYEKKIPVYEAIQWTGSNRVAIEGWMEGLSGLVDQNWWVGEDPEAEDYGSLNCSDNSPVKIRISCPTDGYVVYGPKYGDFLNWTADEAYNGFRGYSESEFLDKFAEQV